MAITESVEINLRVVDGATATLREARTGMVGLGEQANATKSIMTALGAVFATIGVEKLASGVLDAAKKMDSIHFSLQAVTGSTQGAKKEFEYIKDVANRLGLDLENTAEQYAKFASATKSTGIETSISKKMFEDMSAAVSVLHLPVDRASSVFKSLTDMLSKGTINAEDMKNQMGDHLPMALGVLQKELGLTSAQFIKMQANGELLSAEILPRFAKAMYEAVAAGLPGSVQALTAETNRLKNAFFELNVTVAEGGFAKEAAGAFRAATTAISDPFIIKSMENIGAGLGGITKDFVNVGVAAIAFAKDNKETVSAVASGSLTIVQTGLAWVAVSKAVEGATLAYLGLTGGLALVSSKITIAGAAITNAIAWVPLVASTMSYIGVLGTLQLAFGLLAGAVMKVLPPLVAIGAAYEVFSLYRANNALSDELNNNAKAAEKAVETFESMATAAGWSKEQIESVIFTQDDLIKSALRLSDQDKETLKTQREVINAKLQALEVEKNSLEAKIASQSLAGQLIGSMDDEIKRLADINTSLVNYGKYRKLNNDALKDHGVDVARLQQAELRGVDESILKQEDKAKAAEKVAKANAEASKAIIAGYEKEAKALDIAEKDKLGSIDLFVAKGVLSEKEGAAQKHEIAIGAAKKRLDAVSQLIKDLESKEQQGTKDYKTAVTEQGKAAEDLKAARLKASVDTANGIRDRLNEEKKKFKETQDEMKGISLSLFDERVKQAREWMVESRKNMTEEQKQHSIRQEAYGLEQLAIKALKDGDFERAKQYAADAKSVAADLTDQRLKYAFINDSNNILIETIKTKGRTTQAVYQAGVIERENENSQLGITKTNIDAVINAIVNVGNEAAKPKPLKVTTDQAKKNVDDFKEKVESTKVTSIVDANTTQGEVKAASLTGAINRGDWSVGGKPVMTPGLDTTPAYNKMFDMAAFVANAPMKSTLELDTGYAKERLSELATQAVDIKNALSVIDWQNQPAGPAATKAPASTATKTTIKYTSPLQNVVKYFNDPAHNTFWYGRADGGMIPGWSGGGQLPGYSRIDSVPVMLTPGEMVINAETTRAVNSIFPNWLLGLNATTSKSDLARLLGVQAFAGGGHVSPVKMMAVGGKVSPTASGGASIGGGLMDFNITINTIDSSGMHEVFVQKIIPEIKSAISANTGGLKSSIRSIP